MSLSVATPIALALVALLALPVVAHLARQTPVSQQPFGAMLLLERLVKRLRRRRRVRDPLLLLLSWLTVVDVKARSAARALLPNCSSLDPDPELPPRASKRRSCFCCLQQKKSLLPYVSLPVSS